jgi:ectoine hydroxylase-related dioxygenase (phytanoyl-CoA dioxygenase family)
MTQDLSLHHEPVSNFLETSGTTGVLTHDQIEFFHENGYVAGIRILSAEQIELLRDELTGLFDPQHAGRELWHEYHSNESTNPDTVLFHALGAWRVRPGFHDLLWHPTLSRVSAQLLDGPARFWHDQLFCKPARHGGVVAWHQDYSYWTRTQPMAHLTCWIGLDEATRDNGCLQYIPGSHRWNLLPVTGLAGDMQAIRDVLDDSQWKRFQKPVSIELQPGEAAFHHPLMVHGSFENRTNGPRRATVVNMIRDEVCSDTDEPLLQGVPSIPKGDKLDGQFFPLLTVR